MPTKTGINQHDILHTNYPNDCCLCKAEQRIKELEVMLSVEHLTKDGVCLICGNKVALSKPSVEPHKEPLSFNCTLAKFAEQLDVPLWKAMEFGKYFKPSTMSVEEIEKFIREKGHEWEILQCSDGIELEGKALFIARNLHNLITKG